VVRSLAVRKGSMSADPNVFETANAGFAQVMYEEFLRDPASVDAEWRLLFESGDRHITAEQLHAEVTALGEHVSLATVYNTLHQFKRAGLVRELAIEGSKAYFDTNTSNHNHFLLETTGDLMDIPGDAIRVEGLPEPPDGMKITHVDVVVRVSKS